MAAEVLLSNIVQSSTAGILFIWEKGNASEVEIIDYH